MKHKAIVCDIDNCLIDISKIDNVVAQGDITYNEVFAFFEEKANDLDWVVKTAPLFQLIKFYYESDYEIILLTARSRRIQEETYKFLTSGTPKLPKEIIIVSRGLSEEGIPDDELKKLKLEKILEDYDVEICIDDKAKNCEMFKKYGIFTLQVVI